MEISLAAQRPLTFTAPETFLRFSVPCISVLAGLDFCFVVFALLEGQMRRVRTLPDTVGQLPRASENQEAMCPLRWKTGLRKFRA